MEGENVYEFGKAITPSGRWRGEVPTNGEGTIDHDVPAIFIDWPTFWNRDTTAREWLLEPLFPKGRGIAIVAGAKTGKSYLLLYCIAAMATGRAVLHRPSGQAVRCMYLDYEMTEEDVYDRLEDFGYDETSPLEGTLFYALHPLGPPLDTKAGGEALLAHCRERQIDFLAIDTLGKAVEGDENDADTLRSFYRHTGAPLKAAGVTWVRADHQGKDATKGARGTSAKNDDVDIVWQLARTEAGVVAKATHRRLMWVPEEVAIAIGGDDPVVFRINPKAWPLGVEDAANRLDDAGVPLGFSRRKTANMLKAQGESAMRNDLLGPALAWRRERVQMGLEPGTTLGTTSYVNQIPLVPTGGDQSKEETQTPDTATDTGRGPLAGTTGDQSGSHRGPPCVPIGHAWSPDLDAPELTDEDVPDDGEDEE